MNKVKLLALFTLVVVIVLSTSCTKTTSPVNQNNQDSLTNTGTNGNKDSAATFTFMAGDSSYTFNGDMGGGVVGSKISLWSTTPFIQDVVYGQGANGDNVQLWLDPTGGNVVPGTFTNTTSPQFYITGHLYGQAWSFLVGDSTGLIITSVHDSTLSGTFWGKMTSSGQSLYITNGSFAHVKWHN
jgi:hypothetical protein